MGKYAVQTTCKTDFAPLPYLHNSFNELGAKTMQKVYVNKYLKCKFNLFLVNSHKVFIFLFWFLFICAIAKKKKNTKLII